MRELDYVITHLKLKGVQAFLEGAFPVVEQFINGHAAVSQCQVVGVPDARLMEIPVAFVIRKAGAPAITEDEIRTYCRNRIADFKIPRRIFFVEEFPGWMHKVQRFKLKEEAIRRMATSA